MLYKGWHRLVICMKKKELEILRKYKTEKIVDNNDLLIINNLTAIGLMVKGYSLKNRTITAKTTHVGISLLLE